MDDQETGLDLAELHDAIERRLAERFPAVQVEFYPDLQRRCSVPLVVLELSEFDDSRSPGDGTVGLVARFEARIVVDPNLPTPRAAEIAVRMLAARLAAEINFQCWGMPIGPAKILAISPDGFRAELDGYLVWMVEWTHEICVGSPEELPMPELESGELQIGVGVGESAPDAYSRPAELEDVP